MGGHHFDDASRFSAPSERPSSRGRPFAGGERVDVVVTALDDQRVCVDLEGGQKGYFEPAHFRDANGALTIGIGARIVATVESAGDGADPHSSLVRLFPIYIAERRAYSYSDIPPSLVDDLDLPGPARPPGDDPSADGR